MCCYGDKAAKCALLESFGKRKTKVFWKVVGRHGSVETQGYQYGPGVHRAKIQTWGYNVRRPRGFHVFYTEGAREAWLSWGPGRRNEAVVDVVCHRDHLIVAGEGEAVFSRLTIRKADWGKRFRRNKKGGWSRRAGAHLVAPPAEGA